jgi:ribonuclease P protein component
MLPAKNRLKKANFGNICQRGKAVFFQNLSLRAKTNNLLFSRIGFSISGKLFVGAVQRNRAKRILRVALRFYLDKIKPGYDIVIFYKKSKNIEGDKKLEAPKEQIKSLLKKSGLLKN